MSLRSRLEAADPGRLLAAVGGRAVRQIERIRGETDDLASKIARRVDYALAVLGMDALESRQVRQLLFEQLPWSELKTLAEHYGGRSYELPHDNALVLSGVPWRAGTEFVFEMAARLEIETDYLPQSDAGLPRIELVEPFASLAPLHEYQQQVLASGLGLLEAGQKRFLIQLPTGAGKTRTCVELVTAYAERHAIWETGGTVAWLAHMEELCEQAVESFRRVWTQRGGRVVKVVRGWRGKPNLEDVAGSFFACTLQSLSVRATAEHIRRILAQQSRVVVVDEAHRALAPTFANAILSTLNKTTALIGLTATPGRGMGRERDNEALANMFGGALVEPKWPTNPIRHLRSLGVLATLRRRVVESGVEVAAGERDDRDDHGKGVEDLSPATLDALSRNVARNRLITELIRAEVNAGSPTIVFCCSVEHARLLTAVMAVEGVHCGYVDAEMRNATRRRVLDAYRSGELSVLLNFGVLSTGFDAPRTRTVMITRPTTSLVLYSQMVGRGLRGPLMGGGASCTLVDVRDNLRGFGNMEEVYSYFDPYWD